MSRDPLADFNAERERRLQNAAPQVNDERSNTGRFGLAERRAQEDAERIAAAMRGQVVALLTRTLGRSPNQAEIAEALKP